MLDLLIKGGQIIDGTGNPGFYGSLGIEGDKVAVFRGDASHLEAQRTVDATGKVVCPGFIDVHAHSGLVILSEPRHEPKVHQGVTTELIGIDGNSYAPFRSEEDLDQFIRINSGLDGDPPLPGKWSSVAEYLAMFDRKVAVNIAYIVGNAPIRINGVGWNDRPATAPELEDMKALVRESMEDGAVGMSTGLDYPPGSYADTEELVALSTEVTRLGGIYHTHVRNWLGDRYLDPCQEAIDIGRRSGVPVHITHLFRRRTHTGGARPILDLVDQARQDGLDITFDMFPYRYGGTRILITFPHWVHDGGPDKIKEVLRSEEARERLRQEVRPRGRGWDEMWVTYFKQPHNQRFDGKSVAEMADMAWQGPRRRSLRPAPGRGPESVLLCRYSGRGEPRRFHYSSAVYGRKRCLALGRPSTAHGLRHLPSHPVSISPGRTEAAASRCDKENDFLPGPKAGPDGQRRAAERNEGGRGCFRSPINKA